MSHNYIKVPYTFFFSFKAHIGGEKETGLRAQALSVVPCHVAGSVPDLINGPMASTWLLVAQGAMMCRLAMAARSARAARGWGTERCPWPRGRNVTRSRVTAERSLRRRVASCNRCFSHTIRSLCFHFTVVFPALYPRQTDKVVLSKEAETPVHAGGNLPKELIPNFTAHIKQAYKNY